MTTPHHIEPFGRLAAVLGVLYVLGMPIVWSESALATTPPQETVLMLFPKDVVVNNAADGTEGRNDRIFVSDVSTNATSVHWDHADENGDAFFKMLLGWIILSIGFYVLLRIQ
jgi:hypothetical protein